MGLVEQLELYDCGVLECCRSKPNHHGMFEVPFLAVYGPTLCPTKQPYDYQINPLEHMLSRLLASMNQEAKHFIRLQSEA